MRDSQAAVRGEVRSEIMRCSRDCCLRLLLRGKWCSSIRRRRIIVLLPILLRLSVELLSIGATRAGRGAGTARAVEDARAGVAEALAR